MTEFMKALQQNHLSQVIATKYSANPLLLGEHYAINLTPTPPGSDSAQDDPAKASVILIVSVKPGYKSAIFGNVLIPDSMKGEFLLVGDAVYLAPRFPALKREFRITFVRHIYVGRNSHQD